MNHFTPVPSKGPTGQAGQALMDADLLSDYTHDKDLAAFTDLDGDDFL